MPFILLPFRPTSDPSAARTFIRNFFDPSRGLQLQGEGLNQELMLTDPTVGKRSPCMGRGLINLGSEQHNEVVLESPPWGRGHMGGLRALSHWRAG